MRNIAHISMDGSKFTASTRPSWINYEGLFTFIDSGYAASYHDITIRRATTRARNWHNSFSMGTNTAEPIEYLFEDPGYLGIDHFILRHIDAQELSFVDIDPVLKAFNK